MFEQKTLTIPLSMRENGECFICNTRLIDDIKRLKGVKNVDCSEDTCTMLVEYDPNFTSMEVIESFTARQGLKLKSHYGHEHYNIEGLDCPDCASKLEQQISKILGVTWVSLNFATAKIWFEFESDAVTAQTILSTIEKAGYQYREPEVSKIAAEHTSTAFALTGLDCPDCAKKLQNKLAKLEGVEEVQVNFGASSMTVRHEMRLTNRADIIKTVNDAGYQATIIGAESKKVVSGFFSIQNKKLLLTILAGFFIVSAIALNLLQDFLPLHALSVGAYQVTLAHLLYLTAIATGGYYVAKSAYYSSVLTKTFDMNLLMTVAVLGAIAIGELAEGAMVVFLFSLGNLLQSYTLDKARNALKLLMDLAPKEANLKRAGSLMRVPVADLKLRDIIVVKPGEKIPVDGVIITGESPVNEAPITGESLPVDKVPGDQVFAGSVNGAGALEISMEKLAEDSTLARIIHLVEEAQAQKAPSQNFVDRFSRIYTPTVIIGALLVMVVPPLLFSLSLTEWFYRGLMLLVVSCPCALVISTPVSIVSAIACSSRKGILIKGGAYLEEMGAISAIAFDKTGTLTRGRPEVTDIVSLNGSSIHELLRVAASLEIKSEHPLAKAIIRKANQDGVPCQEPLDFASFTGKGVKAKLDGTWGYLGNVKFFNEQGLAVDNFAGELQNLENAGKTSILLKWGDLQGIIALADTPRAEAQQCIAELKQQGMQHITMLSGDNQRVAAAIAGRLGIDEFQADMLPDEKVDAMKKVLAHYGKVAMVGDGINDAPALAVSTVGIAMGAAGTDTALETADVALMADDLLKLPFLMHLSRKTLATIKANIGFSILVKAAFIALVFLGMANLWMAVVADTGTALLVTLYGMRLIRTKDTH